MIDAPVIIRHYLLSQPNLVALTGQRIWAEELYPPEGYTPAQGGAIAFRIRGGLPDYSHSVINPSVQFKCYGSTATAANAVYRAWYDAMRYAGGNGIKSAEVEVLGQTLNDEGTDWPFVLAFGRFWINAS